MSVNLTWTVRVNCTISRLISVAAIISAIGRDAIDALKLVKLKSNWSNRTQSAPDWGPEDHRLSY